MGAKHAGYASEYAELQAATTTPTIDMFGFVDEITLNIYQWMRWIIQRNSPITEVENKLAREVVTMTPITVRTMKTYMRFTAAKVVQTIEDEMGEFFALMYDGWTCHSLHFLGIFAVYVVNGVRNQRLLSLSPMDDGQTASAHLEHMESVLMLYNKDQSMRYMKIRDAILTVSAVEELVPRGNGHRRIAAVTDKLVELDSVCVKLQAEERSMAEVRLLFDACMVKYPEMSEYLQPAAQIVHSPLFESAIVKVQNDLPLSSPEQQEIEAFVLPTNESSPAVRPRVDFASTVLRQAKKRRRSEHVVAKYDPILHEVPPTSNACERLFSGCKLVLTSLRASTLPANFEVMMFLRANMELWNSATLLGCIEDDEEGHL
ncbi:hypothetical protein AM587_10008179 [Phytophthora nicotianae]|uniref:HAT C-terminal dimerisation domain-containing protein n=1 Tax=Phytophthora nicotianae TaxID=4792 RepID=A0A0W8E0W6_PHYNI|nr:hypothetical protein AM587_10008179 [Phytophthora nicotianae]